MSVFYRIVRTLFSAAAASIVGLAAPANASDADVLKELAPTGKLRVAIAVAPTPSAFWAVKDPVNAEIRGVSLELGRALATKLDVPVRFIQFPSSGEIVKAANDNQWDVTFVPVDESRKRDVSFAAPYHVLQSTYLAAPGSQIRAVADANAAGVRIAGVDNTATFRASKATATAATHSTVANVDEALVQLRDGKIDLIALSRESLTGLAAQMPGAKVVEGAFLNSTTAAAVPNGRDRARAYLAAFIEDGKATGLIRRALDSLGLTSSQVAAAGAPP